MTHLYIFKIYFQYILVFLLLLQGLPAQFHDVICNLAEILPTGICNHIHKCVYVYTVYIYALANSFQWIIKHLSSHPIWWICQKKCVQISGPIFRRFHDMPWPPNGSLNVSGSCLTLFRCLDCINIDISILQTGV